MIAEPGAQTPNYGRRILWLGVFVVLLFGGYSAGWFYLAGRLEAMASASDRRAQPRRQSSAECANPVARGFPFRLGVYCDSVALSKTRRRRWPSRLPAFRSGRAGLRSDATSSPNSTARRGRPSADGGVFAFDWENLRASVALATDFPEQRFGRGGRPDGRRSRDAAPPAVQHRQPSRRTCGRTGDDLDLAGQLRRTAASTRSC